MAEMNETARKALRKSVMDARANLRGARDEVLRAQRELTEAQGIFQHWRDEIAALQTAAGDPIEIDPCYPEIK